MFHAAHFPIMRPNLRIRRISFTHTADLKWSTARNAKLGPHTTRSYNVRMTLYTAIGALALLLLASCEHEAGQPELEVATLTAITNDRPYDLVVEIADDPHEIRTGLMGRNTIGRHDGMLFMSQEPRIPQFWMKNTLIPLDMIFIEKGGRVVLIAPDRRPGDLAHVSPDKPVVAVLELEAGKSAQMGLREGDTVILPQ